MDNTFGNKTSSTYTHWRLRLTIINIQTMNML